MSPASLSGPRGGLGGVRSSPSETAACRPRHPQRRPAFPGSMELAPHAGHCPCAVRGLPLCPWSAGAVLRVLSTQWGPGPRRGPWDPPATKAKSPCTQRGRVFCSCCCACCLPACEPPARCPSAGATGWQQRPRGPAMSGPPLLSPAPDSPTMHPANPHGQCLLSLTRSGRSLKTQL